MTRAIRLTASLAVFTLALSSCSASSSQSAQAVGTTAAAAATRHPQSGLAVVPLTVRSHGKVHRFRVEVAGTPLEQAKGLMFRTAMGADEGMIFPMSPARSASFWMKNTVIPLDIIFVGPNGRITNIAANAVPYSEASLPSTGLVKGVLELNGGRAAALDIGPGDVVQW